MDMLAWWNGSYEASGKSDLVYCSQGPIAGERARSIVGSEGTAKSYIVLGNLQICWGSVNITPTANTPTSASIAFSRAFASRPTMITTPYSSVIGTQVLGTSVSNVTTTGCDIYVTRTNATTLTVFWLAIGQA